MMITIVRIITVNVIVLVRIFGMVINIDTVIAVDTVDAVTIYVRPGLFTRRTIFAESVSCSYEKDDPLSSKSSSSYFVRQKVKAHGYPTRNFDEISVRESLLVR